MRESRWQREQLVQRPEQGRFSNSREARGLHQGHQGMEGVVVEDRGGKTKGGEDPGLLPERDHRKPTESYAAERQALMGPPRGEGTVEA